MRPRTVYFVTDVELDGPDPARHSMLSFASVAVSPGAGVLGEFQANLEPRPDRTMDEAVMRWWRTQPDAFAASTVDARPAEAVMPAYADWVESFDGLRAFAARPLMLDGLWMDEYLRTFAGTRALEYPFGGRTIFHSFGIDLPSLLMGMFGWDYAETAKAKLPASWLGDIDHTHRAIDDARGYAHALLKALEISRNQPIKPEDYLRAAAS